MIKFIKHTLGASRPAIVGPHMIKLGDPILKICFTRRDVHTSKSGVMHLDVWGGKIQELKRALEAK